MAAGCSVFLFAIVAIVALIVSIQALQRAKQAREEAGQLRTAVDALTRLVSELRGRVPRQPAAPAKPAAAPPPAPQPAAAPIIVAASPPPPPPPLAAAAVKPAPIQPSPAAPPPPRHPPKTPKRPFDWEALVGVKLFSWIAGLALVLAAIFFFKYSVEHGWLRPAIRAAIGIATGTALIVICELRVARGYKVTANALHGAAIAILLLQKFVMAKTPAPPTPAGETS